MTMSKLKAKLQHPLALIAQGFVAGVIIFTVTAPSDSSAQPADPTPTEIHATR